MRLNVDVWRTRRARRHEDDAWRKRVGSRAGQACGAVTVNNTFHISGAVDGRAAGADRRGRRRSRTARDRAEYLKSACEDASGRTHWLEVRLWYRANPR